MPHFMDMFREMVGRNGKYRIIDSHTSIKGQIEDMIADFEKKEMKRMSRFIKVTDIDTSYDFLLINDVPILRKGPSSQY
jgi:hypothetical protein